MPVPTLRDILGERALLVVVAAPAEADAVLKAFPSFPRVEASAVGPWTVIEPAPQICLLVAGIGKVNAAAGLARVLEQACHAAVLNVGIAGALPGSGAELGMVVAATTSIYADEGLQTPDGFSDCAAMGFPLGPFAGSAIPAHPGLLAVLGPLANLAGPIATVSTCSGTDVLASQVVARTGAVAEAMEGAAVAHVAARLAVPCAEVRAISNTTGDRAGQHWEVRPALAAITRLIGRLAAGR